MRVKVREDFHNNRHGKINDQDADDRGDRTDDHTEERSGHNFTEAESAHRTQRKPQAVHDRNQLIVGCIADTLDVVECRASDQDGHEEEEDEERQQIGRIGDRCHDHLQAWMEID